MIKQLFFLQENKLRKVLIQLSWVSLCVYGAGGTASAADWNPLPDTGQTTCYKGSDKSPCPPEGESYHGQDAQYHGPAMSYTDNGDGTVKDNNTGLIWQKNKADIDNDGSITSSDKTSWQQAVDYCTNVDFGGSSSWRLPDFDELNSLVDYGRSEPRINPVFICESEKFWSATSYAYNTYKAWYVHFRQGLKGSVFSSDKTGSLAVRCVRGGQ